MDNPARLAAARLADEVEAAAFADLYAAAPAPLRERFGIEVAEVAGATLLFAPGLPSPMFNRAIGLGNHAPPDAAAVDAVCAGFRARGVATWWIHASPWVDALPGLLAARGFALPARQRWAKMLRPAADLPVDPGGLGLTTADAGTAAQAAETIVSAFGMPAPLVGWFAALHDRPGWRLVLLRDGPTPVGAGCLFVHRGGGRSTGWLGMGAVLPDWRGRGGQRALLARRIADAAAAGCDQVATETGEPLGDEPNPSLANLRASGFAIVASRRNYQSPESA